MAREFSVRAYPTFVMLNSDGQTVDRWVGYSKQMHLETLLSALTDLSTIDQKLERYESEPTAALANALARYSSAMSQYKEAVSFLNTAVALNTDPGTDYSYKIFTNTFYGVEGEQFTFDDVASAADRVLKSGAADPRSKITAAMRVTYMARQQDRLDMVGPYIEAGLKLASASDNPEAVRAHNELMVAKALYVTHDNDAAVKFKKATMPEGWTEDAGELNSFAWWCFENLVNLEEAEQLTRKGIELAQPGKQKAMILDTLAEICNILDNCTESVEVARMAVAEDPENEFYKKQLARFEEILASNE